MSACRKDAKRSTWLRMWYTAPSMSFQVRSGISKHWRCTALRKVSCACVTSSSDFACSRACIAIMLPRRHVMSNLTTVPEEPKQVEHFSTSYSHTGCKAPSSLLEKSVHSMHWSGLWTTGESREGCMYHITWAHTVIIQKLCVTVCVSW